MYTNVRRNAKENGTTWRSFENTLQVLVCVGALDPKTYKTSILGSVARELNADNELWFAIVLANKALEVPPFYLYRVCSIPCIPSSCTSFPFF